MVDDREGSKLGAVIPHVAVGQPPNGPPDSSTWPREGVASPVASPTSRGLRPRAPRKRKLPPDATAATLRRKIAAAPREARGAARVAGSSATGLGDAPAKPRSGSERRQRSRLAQIRLDEAEALKLEELASASGLSVGAYLRAAGLKSAGVRARPRPSVDRELLARANADLNRVGNNINQIAHALNIGLDAPSYLGEAMRELRGVLAALRRAAGYDSQG
jgi:hypothetical protein